MHAYSAANPMCIVELTPGKRYTELYFTCLNDEQGVGLEDRHVLF